MILRLLVPLLALVAAAVQASRGAWTEALGLLGLAAGLAIQRLMPAQGRLAWIGFGLTAIAVVIVALRMVAAAG